MSKNASLFLFGTLPLIVLSVFVQACSPKFKFNSHSELRVHTYSKFFINVHYVETDSLNLLIDSGDVGDGEKIEKFFTKKGLDLSAVNYLIITHGHPDHAGNAKYFQEKYGLKIIAGADELSMINSGGNDSELCPRGFKGWYIKNTIGKKRYDPFIPDILVEDSLSLRFLGLDGKIINVPGHTDGSLIIFLNELAFTGDLLGGKVTKPEKPDYHIFMCDLEDNLNDIERIVSEPGITTWYPGHFGPLKTEDIQEFISKEQIHN
ncbi:MAG: MBL fold metallo-hydrolase [Bacteroidota bacterium]